MTRILSAARRGVKQQRGKRESGISSRRKQHEELEYFTTYSGNELKPEVTVERQTQSALVCRVSVFYEKLKRPFILFELECREYFFCCNFFSLSFFHLKLGGGLVKPSPKTCY